MTAGDVLKILVGIGHPADVHFFRRFIGEMKGRGHEGFVVVREKEFTCFLLDRFNISYQRVSFHQKRLVRKVIDYFVRGCGRVGCVGGSGRMWPFSMIEQKYSIIEQKYLHIATIRLYFII